jgi:membrane dipeptidase
VLRIRFFDGHNDVLSRLQEAGGERGPDRLTDAERAFLDGGGEGHFDIPRSRSAGLAGGLFALFPAESPDHYSTPPAYADALADTLAMTARLCRLERASDGALRVATDGDELDQAMDDGALAAVLHLEGAEPIGPGLDELEVLYAAGLRSLGLTWSRPNRFATGVPFEFPGDPDQGPGLSGEGRALVAACDELGVLIDTSHLNTRGFWDVAELSERPFVASHSNAHALCPSPRNLTDDQLRAIGEHNGLVGLNYHVGFLRADGAEDTDTPLETLAAHATHIAEHAGVDSLALGSDFDGALMPHELADVTRLPALADALRAAGFTEDQLERIAWRNWRRVLFG